MTHLLKRTALILLAGSALGALSGGAGAAETYTVRKGDTLGVIAGRMDTSIEALAKVNGLKKPYRLTPGDKISGPESTPTKAKSGAKASSKSAAKVETETYVVKPGDTLFAIARRFGVSVDELKAANGMGRSSSLVPGRKLKLGGTEAAPDDAPPPERARTTRKSPPVPPKIVPPEPDRSFSGRPSSGRPSSDREATGRVVSIDTPGKAYRVKSGDTLEKIARRLDSEIDDLARINKLKPPYRLQPGQTIRGSGGSARAYVVGRGDTLAEIAQRFSTTVDKLRAVNGLKRGAGVAPGRKLRLPAGYRDRGSFVAPTRESESVEPRLTQPEYLPDRVPPGTPKAEGLPDRPQPYVAPPSARRPSSTFTPQGSVNGAPVASPAISDGQISQMGQGLFQWPIRGAILSGFGDKGTSQRNDGLNVRANTGDPIQSAASGEVVYAGDQVPGFGNLVLIKHADGWVTAYGHLGRVIVRMQQKVIQGQTIGEAGSTGGVSEPQLHFEVRHAPTPQERARPINPELVLPR